MISVESDLIKHCIDQILRLGIGEKYVDPECLENTPDRVARAYEELFIGYRGDPAEILSRVFKDSHDEMVIVSGIPMFSMCEHHMLPFIGEVHVGYIPDGYLLGISKIARLVEIFARRMQLQERLTSQIANSIMEHVKPKGVAVVVSAEHTCMTMRGVNKPGARTTTSAMRGLFKDDAKSRAEFLELIKK